MSEFVRIAADNVHSLHSLKQLRKQRRDEINNYTERGMRVYGLQDELNTLLDASPDLSEERRTRIREITAELQPLLPLLKPNVKEMDAEIIMNRLKVKENQKKTLIYLSSERVSHKN